MSPKKAILIVVGVLIALTLIILWLSAGKSEDSAHAATIHAAAKYPKGLPRCTKAAGAKKRCTKKQAQRVINYAKRGHSQDHKSLHAVRPPSKAHASAVRCRTWKPRLYFVANAGKLFWGGFSAYWCFNWKRVTSIRVVMDADITTLGRVLGFDHIGFQDPFQGFYNYGKRTHGGYLVYARMTFEQCIPVVQIGPLCHDKREWRKIFLHYNGGGLVSSHAP